MEKKNTLLKVVSIIMIVGSFLSIIVAVVPLITLIAVMSAVGEAGMAFLVVAAVLLALIGVVINLTAGILGIRHTTNPEKANTLILFGILSLIVAIISAAISIFTDQDQSIFVAAAGLVLPILYIYAASKNRVTADKVI